MVMAGERASGRAAAAATPIAASTAFHAKSLSLRQMRRQASVRALLSRARQAAAVAAASTHQSRPGQRTQQRLADIGVATRLVGPEMRAAMLQARDNRAFAELAVACRATRSIPWRRHASPAVRNRFSRCACAAASGARRAATALRRRRLPLRLTSLAAGWLRRRLPGAFQARSIMQRIEQTDATKTSNTVADAIPARLRPTRCQAARTADCAQGQPAENARPRHQQPDQHVRPEMTGRKGIS
jgi:hypothetical protein